MYITGFCWTRRGVKTSQSSMLLKPLDAVVGSTRPARRPRRHISARRAPIRLADTLAPRFKLYRPTKEETLFLDHRTDGFCKCPRSMANCRPRGCCRRICTMACIRAVMRLQSLLKPRNNSWSCDKPGKVVLLSDVGGPDSSRVLMMESHRSAPYLEVFDASRG